ASQFAPILNLRDKIPGLAKLSEMLLDLSSERNLPKWRRKHFFNQPQEIVSKEAVLAADKPVVLFVDTFTGYLESDIAQAAVRVLNRAGYAVHVATRAPSDNAPHLCCGRTFLASGLLELAREKMADLIVHLAPFAEAGIPVVGLEPSCLLTLRDEALAMNLGEQAIRVAENAVLFEEFLEQAMASGDLDLLRAQLTDARQPFLVHAHCHQKAMGADKSIAKVLGMIPNADVEMIESSCCGMAGAFGYEVEHITASRQMAEASLLPTIRKRPDSLVIADGTSCRHQIQDHDTARAHHVATVIDRHLSHAP
ncbi:MAG: (Fe-S)-binding protein, partial [Burkholderiaceae bacterium]